MAPKTTLIAFLKICKTDILAKKLIYQDIYTWQQASTIWKK